MKTLIEKMQSIEEQNKIEHEAFSRLLIINFVIQIIIIIFLIVKG